jgi:hypothetical protein
LVDLANLVIQVITKMLISVHWQCLQGCWLPREYPTGYFHQWREHCRRARRTSARVSQCKHRMESQRFVSE